MFRRLVWGVGGLFLALSAPVSSSQGQVPIDKSRIPAVAGDVNKFALGGKSKNK